MPELPVRTPTTLGPPQTTVGVNASRRWIPVRMGVTSVDAYSTTTGTFPQQVTSYMNAGLFFRTAGFLNNLMRFACTGGDGNSFVVTLLGVDEKQGDGANTKPLDTDLWPKAVTLGVITCTLGTELATLTMHPIFTGRAESSVVFTSVDTLALETGAGSEDLVLNNPFDSGADNREASFEFSTSYPYVVVLITTMTSTTRVDVCVKQES